MSGEIRDECGIVAAVDLGRDPATGESFDDHIDVAPLIPTMLVDIQNRGQLAAGITSYNPERREILRTHKELGSVAEVFNLSNRNLGAQLIEGMSGSIAIGHTRYSTSGADDRSYAQPLERVHGRPFKWFAFCFNGNIANHQHLSKQLTDRRGYHLQRPDSDTELFLHTIAFQLRANRRPSWQTVFRQIDRSVDGAWSLAMVTADGDLVAARDSLGVKPLCYGTVGRTLLVASESTALQNAGVAEIKDVPAGALLQVRKGQIKVTRFSDKKNSAHCFFEWVYFANVASVMDGRSVYQARAELGRALAAIEEEEIGDDHIVVPVPDTSKASGDAFAYALGIPSIEGLVRNRYLGRTFIESDDRAAKVRRKFTALRGILEGKKVFLVDDSIVRSTTLTYLIDYIREEGGAAEIHIRIACPPIMSPCFYGIDMSTIRELFAPRFLDKALRRGPLPPLVRMMMADAIGADSLQYLPADEVPKALGFERNDLCMACVTREYPTAAGRSLFKQALADHQEGRKTTGRITTNCATVET